MLLFVTLSAFAAKPHQTITLAWDAPVPMPVCDDFAYLLFQSTNSGGELTAGNEIYEGSNTTFSLVVYNGMTNYFEVFCWCDGVWSTNSNEVMWFTPVTNATPPL